MPRLRIKRSSRASSRQRQRRTSRRNVRSRQKEARTRPRKRCRRTREPAKPLNKHWTTETRSPALTPPARATVEIAAELERAKGELARIGPPAHSAALQSALEGLETGIAAATAAVEAARRTEIEASNAAAAAERSYSDALATIPPDLREATMLVSAIKALETALSTTVADLEAATGADREAVKALAAAQSEVETIAAEVKRMTDHLAQQESEFTARLAENGLSPRLMKSAKPMSPPFRPWRRAYRATQGIPQRQKPACKRAADVIATLQRPDLVALAAARMQLRQRPSAPKTAATTAAAAWLSCRSCRTTLPPKASVSTLWRGKQSPLRELAKAMTGRTYQQVDLETFAISTLFDRVLDAANLRLAPMTSGRYALFARRKDEAMRAAGSASQSKTPTPAASAPPPLYPERDLHRGASPRTRPLRHRGKRIRKRPPRYIFIDEGFGSLDSDGESGTLEKVIQTLQNIVGASRSVGLISHVPLVQQAIPNGFFVTKTHAGSHIEVRT